MTHPENINYPRQKYYTTEVSKEVLRLKPEEENKNKYKSHPESTSGWLTILS